MVMVLTMAVIYDGDPDSNDDDNDGYNDGGDDGYDDDGDPFSHWMQCALRCPIQCSRPHPHSLNIVAINVSSPFSWADSAVLRCMFSACLQTVMPPALEQGREILSEAHLPLYM